MTLRAIIYVPSEDSERWQARCIEHCDRKGYAAVSLVIDATREQWRAVCLMLMAGEADVLVVGRRDHLAADRLPRIEYADEARPVKRRARPWVIRRDGGA